MDIYTAKCFVPLLNEFNRQVEFAAFAS